MLCFTGRERRPAFLNIIETTNISWDRVSLKKRGPFIIAQYNTRKNPRDSIPPFIDNKIAYFSYIFHQVGSSGRGFYAIRMVA